MIKPISFCYKGDRDYVHGTDILNNSVEAIREGGFLGEPESFSILMSINSLSRNSLTLYSSDTIQPNEKVAVRLNLESPNFKKQFFLVEDKRTVDCKYPYPENSIIDSADFDMASNEIKLSTPTEFSFVENVVALNKGLLQKKFSDVRGKWFFTKIKLTYLPIACTGTLKLKFVKNLNFKLVESAIYYGDNFIGSIYFSLA